MKAPSPCPRCSRPRYWRLRRVGDRLLHRPVCKFCHGILLRDWKAKNPEAVRAHRLVHKALKCGVLKRQPCRVCGSAHSEAHHADYSRPLAVDWLCRADHKAEHKKQREARP